MTESNTNTSNAYYEMGWILTICNTQKKSLSEIIFPCVCENITEHDKITVSLNCTDIRDVKENVK